MQLSIFINNKKEIIENDQGIYTRENWIDVFIYLKGGLWILDAINMSIRSIPKLCHGFSGMCAFNILICH